MGIPPSPISFFRIVLGHFEKDWEVEGCKKGLIGGLWVASFPAVVSDQYSHVSGFVYDSNNYIDFTEIKFRGKIFANICKACLEACQKHVS